MKYKVICDSCGGSSEIAIDQIGRVDWQKVGSVISARERMDRQWGFQCSCGANSLTTEQERRTIKDLENPRPRELDEILGNLKVEYKTGFKMQKVEA